MRVKGRGGGGMREVEDGEGQHRGGIKEEREVRNGGILLLIPTGWGPRKNEAFR